MFSIPGILSGIGGSSVDSYTGSPYTGQYEVSYSGQGFVRYREIGVYRTSAVRGLTVVTIISILISHDYIDYCDYTNYS